MSEPSNPPPTRGLARRIMLGTVFGAMVFAGLSLYGDVRALVANLSTFAWSTFALALALASANYGIRFVRWQFYLRALDVHVPAGESLLVFLAGFVMSVTPGKLGEVFKSFLLWEARDVSVARTAPIVLAERLTDLLALVALTAIGSLFFDQGAVIAAIGGALVLSVIAVVSIRPLAELALSIAAKLPGLKRIAPRLREAWEALATLVRPAPLVMATLLATFSWGLECIALWAIVGGFEGAHIDLGPASLAYAASTIAGALAMLPGGLGVTEAGMAGSLQVLGVGVTASIATGATLLVRLATLWWAVVVGAIALFVLRRTARRSS
ncbi:lysylphosphatidylglycerol synthase transmembrane domain-containing protein [Sandaracinus amylolyticus]|uniref:lysylphosphatidylglycerol synthase transmembrane domain-containing protein n=1 Tax=Sandaracinus amylolyticus TaxID=927083 RepID=UPI001F411D08|nr:lysylphosphatidylglycerol synthase transmembrane domain-containing protein [Sandaracinus amylolyticus]UJR80919.1 Integral membrane protein [Sandaracinus amylolyticus]